MFKPQVQFPEFPQSEEYLKLIKKTNPKFFEKYEFIDAAAINKILESNSLTKIQKSFDAGQMFENCINLGGGDTLTGASRELLNMNCLRQVNSVFKIDDYLSYFQIYFLKYNEFYLTCAPDTLELCFALFK